MLTHGDGTHSGTTTALRNTEGLVQIEMTDISPEGSWPAEADLGIEIGAIQIHLSAMVMNQAADLTDSGLEDPMG